MPLPCRLWDAFRNAHVAPTSPTRCYAFRNFYDSIFVYFCNFFVQIIFSVGRSTYNLKCKRANEHKQNMNERP